MNRQHTNSGGEASEASPLSLLVHAADAQNQRPSSKRASNGGSSRSQQSHAASGAMRREINEQSLEEQIMQRQVAAARAEAAFQQHQGLLPHHLQRGIEAELYQQSTLAAAAQQQQQHAAAMAMASDLRSAVAAAQLRQAAQMQNHDLLLARAAQQQLGGFGAAGLDQFQELELQRLEELERRHLLAQAASGHAPPRLSSPALAARQFEMQEAQLRHEQLERLQQEALLDRVSRGGAPELAPTQSADATGATSSAKGDGKYKDSFERTPGSVVVPCRARGMPMDHNFKTAYFVIPENVEHGEELICSYFACRNAGIKFRYCTYCKVPVAKRNFRKRHRHGFSEKGANNGADDDSQSGDEAESSTGSRPDKHKSAGDAAKAVTAGGSESEDESNKPSSKKSDYLAKKQPPKASSSGEVASKKSGAEEQSSDKIDGERERRWASLLAKRPPTKDGSAMSGWLMEVLAVSDLETPLSDKSQGNSSKSDEKADPSEADSAKPCSSVDVGDPDKDKIALATLPSQSVLVKKKRPLAMLVNKDEDVDEKPEVSGSDPSDNDGGGGFAEWKDRKKQKVLHKKGMPE